MLFVFLLVENLQTFMVAFKNTISDTAVLDWRKNPSINAMITEVINEDGPPTKLKTELSVLLGLNFNVAALWRPLRMKLNV